MINRIVLTLVRNSFVAFCVAASAACTAGIGDEATKMDDDRPEEEVTDEAQQAIGEPSCADLPPSHTYTGFVPAPGYLSPPPGTLTHAGCFTSFAVQINNYSSLHLGVGDYGGTFTTWAGDSLSTQAACESAFIRADVYREIFGIWMLVASKQAFGSWAPFFDGFHCHPPGVGFRNATDDPNVWLAGRNYKVVATARIPAGFDETPRFNVHSLLDGYIS